MGKVESLHRTTPAEIFESGIENYTDIEAVAVSVLWKNGTVTTGWSKTDVANVALMILALDEDQWRKHL